VQGVVGVLVVWVGGGGEPPLCHQQSGIPGTGH
jgi:hypothetical protein